MKIKKLGILLFLVCFAFSSLGIQVYAASVGEQLLQPESGWKRIDDKDSRFSYSEGIINYSSNNFYNGGCIYFDTEGEEIKFNFTGDKLRIIANNWNSYSDNISVIIDNQNYIMDQSTAESGGNVACSINFEKTDLSDSEHSVIIRTNDKFYCAFDAVDIDENGELKPYNEITVESVVLDIEPEKEKIKVNEKVTADLVIDNISEIAAEDIKIEYDEEKLEFSGFEEVDGMKLVKSIEETDNGELRVIIASEGEDNIVDNKEILLKLEFKGIETGEALVDVIKGRVTDGIEMEKDLTDEECGEGTIIIEAMADVNNSGEFTLLDLGIDARHFSKDPESSELEDYNTDVVANGEIDEDDLLEIAKYMLENPNYEPNN
ncbi:cohesin domain-containing protein [Wukongibacter baidiensis]|uniref:cohesin domain-containing protein n=1 Tax=Wukongibacter baidiensis TaxID=1723361 RepID=UPI003D7FC378